MERPIAFFSRKTHPYQIGARKHSHIFSSKHACSEKYNTTYRANYSTILLECQRGKSTSLGSVVHDLSTYQRRRFRNLEAREYPTESPCEAAMVGNEYKFSMFTMEFGYAGSPTLLYGRPCISKLKR